jgi:hypothetical protein
MYIDNKLVVKNYYVCSIGKLNVDGEVHTVSIGVLGKVFMLSKFNEKDVIQEQSLNI